MLLPKYVHLPITIKEHDSGIVTLTNNRKVYESVLSLRANTDSNMFPFYTMILRDKFDIVKERRRNGDTYLNSKESFKLNPLLIFPLNRLYHGSPTLNIKNLQTKPTHLFKNTNVVFAGERWIGISNVANWSDDDIIQGVNNNIPFMREARKNAFREVFGKGGYIYEVNKDLFTQHSLISVYEYYSKFNVPILKQTYITNPLAELIKMGVIVTTYNNIRMEQW